MKRRQLRLISYCLAIWLVAVLVLVMVSCASKSSSTTVPVATTTTLTSTSTEASTTLSSIAVSPNPPARLTTGSTQQFTATGHYSDGSTNNVSSQVTWDSDSPGISTISVAGLATGIAAGNADITATLSGLTSPSVSLTVVAPIIITTTTTTTMTTVTLSSITIAPNPPPSLTMSSTQQFTATGNYSDGSTKDISSQITWTSSNSAAATISSTGLANGVAVGVTNITATISGLPSLSVKLVVIPKLSSITLLPSVATFNLAAGFTRQLTATGNYSDGSTNDISSQVTWSSSNPGVATISSAGLITSVAPGITQIAASLSGVTSSNIILTVLPLSTTVH
jgi:trimeric autotransporter adhesin